MLNAGNSVLNNVVITSQNIVMGFSNVVLCFSSSGDMIWKCLAELLNMKNSWPFKLMYLV
jgi:hypothetical protein